MYDEAGDIALSYDTRSDTLSLCPGRLENAQVVEALQDAVLFIMDGPAPRAENRNFRRHEMDEDDGDSMIKDRLGVANAVGGLAQV